MILVLQIAFGYFIGKLAWYVFFTFIAHQANRK